MTQDASDIEPPSAEKPRRRPWIVGAVAFAVILAGGALAIWQPGSDGKPTTPRDVARKLGCESTFKTESTDELFVDRAGECIALASRVEVQIRTFESKKTLDMWWEIASAFGTSHMRRAGLVVIEVDSEDQDRLDDLVSRLE